MEKEKIYGFRWCSIDPGLNTGITIWDENGNPEYYLTIHYKLAIHYLMDLERIRLKYNIAFSVIEEYVFFTNPKRRAGVVKSAFKVETQVQLCKEVFVNHVLINPGEWNVQRLNNNGKKEFIYERYGIELDNEHQRDSFIIGHWIKNQAVHKTAGRFFVGLWAFSYQPEKKFETRRNQIDWDLIIKNFKPNDVLPPANR